MCFLGTSLFNKIDMVATHTPLAGTKKIMWSFETATLKMLENVGFILPLQNKRVLRNVTPFYEVLTKLVGCPCGYYL